MEDRAQCRALKVTQHEIKERRGGKRRRGKKRGGQRGGERRRRGEEMREQRRKENVEGRRPGVLMNTCNPCTLGH